MGRGTTRRVSGRSAGTLPIRNYDDMTVGEIRSEMQDLSAGDIRRLQSYEEKHKRRQTLLRAFETRGSMPSRGTTARRSGTSTARRTSRGGSTGRERAAGARGNTAGGGSSKRTTNHDTIRRWIERRGGVPVSVRGTARGDNAGVLRIDFEGYGAGSDELREISWGEFFKKFDDKNLEFLYQDRTRGGNESRFFKFVSREGNASRRA